MDGRPDRAERVAWLDSLPGWLWNASRVPEMLAAKSSALKKAMSRPEEKERISKWNARIRASNAITWGKKKREYLENARQEARPFEPKVAKRIKGAFYVRPDGNIGRWSGTAMHIIGPMRDPDSDGRKKAAGAENHDHRAEQQRLETVYGNHRLACSAITWGKKKREYLENARQEARPFEPKVAKRIKSAFYVRPDGNIGRWDGTAMRIIGPMRDPEPAGPSSSAPMDFEEPECSSSDDDVHHHDKKKKIDNSSTSMVLESGSGRKVVLF